MTSASPIVKVVRGMMDAIGSEKGEMGKFLRQAPNWGKITNSIENIRTDAPASVDTQDAGKYRLYFHLKTGYEEAIRQYATRAYGLPEEVAEIVVES